MTDQIRICDSSHNYEIPLIFTMAFPGVEFWCPVCDCAWGMLGAGERVPATPALIERQERLVEITGPYLRARGTFTCAAMKIDGKHVNREDFPQSMLDEARKTIDEWTGVPDSVFAPVHDGLQQDD